MTQRLRSEEKEVERQKALAARFARLTPAQQARVPAILPDKLEVRKSMWKGGIEPMPFDAFCVALDGKHMFPRQVQAWDLPNTLRAANILSPTRTVKEWVLIWGKRCLAGETLLEDEATGQTRPIKEWARLNAPLTLLTTDGAKVFCAPAMPAFHKGREMLYRVTLEDGRTFRATANHQCLTPDGWQKVKELVPGLTPVLALPLPSNVQTIGLQPCRRAWEGLDHSSVSACVAPCCTNCRPVLLRNSTISSIVQEEEGDFYDLTVPGTHSYFDASGILHHNSGKDFFSSKFLTYYVYILHHLAELPAVYMANAAGLDLSPDTRLDIINVAPNERLALQVFFDYMKTWLKKPIMRQFAVYPDPDAWKPGTNEIIFPAINLHLYSKTSKTCGSDGYNLLAFLMDEADAFLDAAGKSNAEALHNMLRVSAHATFGPFSTGLVISYPRTENGFMLRLEQRALKRPDLFYVDKAATDEVRPNFDINDPQVQEEFEYDPAAANAMYRCIPMATDMAFYEMPEKIDECIDASRTPIAETTPKTTTRTRHDGEVSEFVSVALSRINVTPGYRYFIAGDGGLKGDSFGIGVMHIDDTNDAPEWLCPDCGDPRLARQFATYVKQLRNVLNDERVVCGYCYQTPGMKTPISGRQGWYRKQEATTTKVLAIGGREVSIPHIYEDLLIEVQPKKKVHPQDKAMTVDFEDMEEVLTQLTYALNPVKVRLDPWNTAQMIQGLQRTGADVDQISFSQPEQYLRARVMKALIYTNNITLLQGPSDGRDSDKARREMRQLQRNGMKIDHPDGGSKDLYDVRAINVYCAATFAVDELRIIFDPGASGE